MVRFAEGPTSSNNQVQDKKYFIAHLDDKGIQSSVQEKFMASQIVCAFSSWSETPEPQGGLPRGLVLAMEVSLEVLVSSA